MHTFLYFLGGTFILVGYFPSQLFKFLHIYHTVSDLVAKILTCDFLIHNFEWQETRETKAKEKLQIDKSL